MKSVATTPTASKVRKMQNFSNYTFVYDGKYMLVKDNATGKHVAPMYKGDKQSWNLISDTMGASGPNRKTVTLAEATALFNNPAANSAAQTEPTMAKSTAAAAPAKTATPAKAAAAPTKAALAPATDTAKATADAAAAQAKQDAAAAKEKAKADKAAEREAAAAAKAEAKAKAKADREANRAPVRQLKRDTGEARKTLAWSEVLEIRAELEALGTDAAADPKNIVAIATKHGTLKRTIRKIRDGKSHQTAPVEKPVKVAAAAAPAAEVAAPAKGAAATATPATPAKAGKSATRAK